MRTVGVPELRTFIAAVEELERASQRGLSNAEANAARLDALDAQGRQAEADEFSAGALASWQLELAAIGARYEKAAVALLGEARGADETIQAYVFRTVHAAQDFKRMRAMRIGNGIDWE